MFFKNHCIILLVVLIHLIFQEYKKMKEPCRFYSLLLPLRQHEALQAMSRERGVPLAKLIRSGIDLLLKGDNYECDAKNKKGGCEQ